MSEASCPHSAPTPSREPTPTHEPWCPERSSSATAQKGIVPTRTHQEPSPRLQQNDKHCLKTCLLKALLVNGSLGKTVNTRHAVQLPKSSALSRVPEQNQHPGEICGLQRMPNRTSLMMLAPRPCCQQKLLGNGSGSCY